MCGRGISTYLGLVRHVIILMLVVVVVVVVEGVLQSHGLFREINRNNLQKGTNEKLVSVSEGGAQHEVSVIGLWRRLYLLIL